MSDRIAAAASQATPEQVKAAHEALERLIAGKPKGNWFPGESEANAIRAALPPLPDPERPRITPARELVANHWQSMGSSRYPDQPSVACVLKRDAEILAWWENESLHCETCVRLMRAIREADRL